MSIRTFTPIFVHLKTRDLISVGYMRYVNATPTAERPTYVALVGLVFQTIYNDDVLAGIENPEDVASGSLFYKLYEDIGDQESSGLVLT
jgi:hypothetical protein